MHAMGNLTNLMIYILFFSKLYLYQLSLCRRRNIQFISNMNYLLGYNPIFLCFKPIGVPSLHADANPHYGTGKGATIYRFTSDQYSTFYTKVMNTNERETIHVIDGLLHHETDLRILGLYTRRYPYSALQ